MQLETWVDPGELYLYRQDEVNPARPIFTGDVFDDVPIPGVQDDGMAIVVAHPCAMRGRGAELLDRVLVARVTPAEPVASQKWQTGFYNRMPLPNLLNVSGTLHVAWLDAAGRALSEELTPERRLACLTPFGVNLLQQRMVFNLTRHDVPTKTLWEAFGHTYEEADLLESWMEDVPAATAAGFEEWLREGDRSRQERLRDPQQRGAVRSELRQEINRRS